MPKKVHNALTPIAVRNAEPGRHTDGNGLQLLVKQTGARSWVYRFTLNGKTREVGLGSADAGGRSLADARDEAAALRVKVKSGVDPIAERAQEAAEARAMARDAEAASVSFKDAAEAYIKANQDTWRNDKHRQQWKNTLADYVYPVIGDLPVGEVDTPHILQILEPIWKTKSETASRVRGRIETVLDSAKAKGYRQGENSAAWKGHLALILPARPKLSRGHHKALPYDEVPALLNSLHEMDAVGALALEFTILTAVRSAETYGATWEEFDLDKGVWTIPDERMKAAREHRVPLSERALAIVAETKALDGTYVFPGKKGGKLSNMAMAMIIRRLKLDATVHGFRSSFRDWAAERTSYSHEVCELALAHTVGNAVERAYRRGDQFEKRRRLMDDWATFCATDALPESNVTPIRLADSA